VGAPNLAQFGVMTHRERGAYCSYLTIRDCAKMKLFDVQRSGRRNDQYASQSSANDSSMPAEKRLRTDQRTGLDCIKQEYQEHLPSADYAADPTKRLASNPPQEMPPLPPGQYGHGADQATGFGPPLGNQPTPYGYWQTSQGATHSDSYPPADSWNSQQLPPIKQEYSSGYPEMGFPQQQQDYYNRSLFDNMAAPSSQAAGGSLAYSQGGEWNQAYNQAAQSQATIPMPGQGPLVDPSGAYVTDPAMMSGASQWGFPAPPAPKVEPGVPSSTVPYGVSTPLPPPSLGPPAGQPGVGLPPATAPSTGLSPFSQMGPNQPPVEFPASAPTQPFMRLPPPQPRAGGQQHMLEMGGYGGGQSWNNRTGTEQKPDVALGRQAADRGPQSQPNIPSLLSEEQISAMRMDASERERDREEVGERGRDFERGRESSWRDRSAGDRRDRDREGGREFGGRGDRGQWGEDRSRQGRDSGGGRIRDEGRGDRDRRDFSHGRDGARSGRDERDRYDRGRSDRDRNFGRSRDRDDSSRDRDYNRDSRDRERDRTGHDRDREMDRSSRDGSHESGRSQRRDDQAKRSSRWGPQEDVKPLVSLDVRPPDSSSILGPPPDASKSLNMPEIKTEPGLSAPPGESSLLGPPPTTLPPTSMNAPPPTSAAPPSAATGASNRPPVPPAPAIKPDPDLMAGGRANDGILGEMPTVPPAAGDVAGGEGGGMEEMAGTAFRGPRPPSGPPPPQGRFPGAPPRGPPPPPSGRGGPPPFRGPPPFGGPPMPLQRGLRPPPPPGFGPGGPGIAGPPPGMPPGPMPPVRGGPPRWPPRAPGPPRPFR